MRAPKGFHFEIADACTFKYCDTVDCNVYISLFDNKTKKCIGHVNLYPMDRKTRETHSYLEGPYWGRGFGALMYARAIQWCLDNGYKVHSSRTPSDRAKRVWEGKTLRKLFCIHHNISLHKPAYTASKKRKR